MRTFNGKSTYNLQELQNVSARKVDGRTFCFYAGVLNNPMHAGTLTWRAFDKVKQSSITNTGNDSADASKRNSEFVSGANRVASLLSRKLQDYLHGNRREHEQVKNYLHLAAPIAAALDNTGLSGAKIKTFFGSANN